MDMERNRPSIDEVDARVEEYGRLRGAGRLGVPGVDDIH